VSEVFPDYEVLGWYLVSSAPSLSLAEEGLHRQIATLTESPLLLHLHDAGITPSQRTVPLAVYLPEGRPGAFVHAASVAAAGTDPASVSASGC
jgi:hypothetical protein